MVDHAGDNLRRLMSRLGLTIEQVAARSHLDQRTVRGILDGSNHPHARTLHRLAAALEVAPDEFFLDPGQLAYRCFDQATNPVVAEVVEGHPDLFSGWTEADYEELNSRFGTGGPLTVEGTLAAVGAMNRNRMTLEKLAVLLESSQAELIRGIVEVMYDKLAGADTLEATAEVLSSPKKRRPAP
jgi:transcriptional regulator with XRE-family HTH domain